jgi:signal transduction histidine kinase/DNA-binding NarL/FixJ family response regulator
MLNKIDAYEQMLKSTTSLICQFSSTAPKASMLDKPKANFLVLIALIELCWVVSRAETCYMLGLVLTATISATYFNFSFVRTKYHAAFELAIIFMLCLVPCGLAYNSVNTEFILVYPLLLVTSPVCCLALSQKLGSAMGCLIINSMLFMLQKKAMVNLIGFTSDIRGEKMIGNLIVGLIGISVILTMLYYNLLITLNTLKPKPKKSQVPEKETKQDGTEVQAVKGVVQDKTKFLLSLSHELKNPLNSALGYLELALNNCNDRALQNYIDNCKLSCDSLVYLINNLLDYGKCDAEQLEMSYVPTNMKSFVEKIWTNTSLLINRLQLHGELYFAKNIPESLVVDPHRLMQVMFNLIGNAVKFTNTGHVKIIFSWISTNSITDELMQPTNQNQLNPCEKNVSYNSIIGDSKMQTTCYSESSFEAKKEEDMEETTANRVRRFPSCFFPTHKAKSDAAAHRMFDRLDFTKDKFRQMSYEEDKNNSQDGVLKIEVQDTGCGMSPEMLNSLYEKSNLIQNKEKLGAGLGLWVTKQICKTMGGDIKAHSKEGEGSTFVVAIKCQNVYIKVPQSMNRKLSSVIFTSKPKSKLNILVVDDMKTNRDINIHFLKKCGIKNIYEASNGQEAVELFRKHMMKYFDMILMDLEMPVMGGKEASKWIRYYEDVYQWEPVNLVIITANTIQSEFAECRNAPIKANYVYSKPFTFSMCKALIERYDTEADVSIASPITESPKCEEILLIDNNFERSTRLRQILTELNMKYSITTDVLKGKAELDESSDRLKAVFISTDLHGNITSQGMIAEMIAKCKNFGIHIYGLNSNINSALPENTKLSRQYTGIVQTVEDTIKILQVLKIS